MARKVRTLINHPRTVLSRYFLKKALLMYYKVSHPQQNFIADMTWDNLIVLDACRYDVFVKLNAIPGKLRKIISAGSSTSEWLQNNFSGRNLKDVIYVSANPWGSYYWLRKTLGHIPFYKIVEVWKDGWSEELNTVHPSAVNVATLDSLVSNPQKRHLVHYIQPHLPFIGDVRIRGGSWKQHREKMRGTKSGARAHSKREPSVWQMLRENTIEVNVVWRAYVSNLQLVLGYIKELLPNLSGKVCITSDHGNAFGRFGLFYGHSFKIPIPELIEVPWFEVQAEQ